MKKTTEQQVYTPDDRRDQQAPASPAASFKTFYTATPGTLHPCPLCKGQDFEIITTSDRHDIGLPTAICCHCGLVQTNPRPDPAWYSTFYKQYFWKTYIGDKKISYSELYKKDEQDAKGKAYTVLFSSVLSEKKDTRLESARFYLDIGSGLGGVVRHMCHANPHVRLHCIEPDSELAKHVKYAAPEMKVHDSLASVPDGQFDLISLIHVLEHVNDPVSYLADIREN